MKNPQNAYRIPLCWRAGMAISVAMLLAVMTTVMIAGIVPNPTITGPIPSTGIPGDQAHDYIFFAS
jgi:hypothetical protein